MFWSASTTYIPICTYTRFHSPIYIRTLIYIKPCTCVYICVYYTIFFAVLIVVLLYFNWFFSVISNQRIVLILLFIKQKGNLSMCETQWASVTRSKLWDREIEGEWEREREWGNEMKMNKRDEKMRIAKLFLIVCMYVMYCDYPWKRYFLPFSDNIMNTHTHTSFNSTY